MYQEVLNPYNMFDYAKQKKHKKQEKKKSLPWPVKTEPGGYPKQIPIKPARAG